MRLIRENKCRRKIGVWHLKSSLLHFFPFYICLFSHTRSFLFYFFHSCFVLLLYLVSNFTVLHLLFFSLCRCISSCKDLLRLKFFVVHGHSILWRKFQTFLCVCSIERNLRISEISSTICKHLSCVIYSLWLTVCHAFVLLNGLNVKLYRNCWISLFYKIFTF